MEPEINRIVFVTEWPQLIAGLRGLLHTAALTAEMSVLLPDALCGNLSADETFLVILDAESHLSWKAIGMARQKAPGSRFVVISSGISPQLIHDVIENGLHGVLSSWLPVQEAAEALTQICRGECQFRFGPESAPRASESHREIAAPTVHAWMGRAGQARKVTAC